MIAQSLSRRRRAHLADRSQVADRSVAERAAQPVRHSGAARTRPTFSLREFTWSAASSRAANVARSYSAALHRLTWWSSTRPTRSLRACTSATGATALYDETSDEALMAHRVRGFLRSASVLLLTATPIQNSLAELWGLVQYVEPTGTLLGDITTFRQVFCGEDDRTLVPGQEHELQRRLAMVLQRTLRRQAQEFLDRPFTQRRCRLYEYAMSDDERSLYDDVTEYLLQPSLYAFAGRQRRLLLIGFHRRMASSIPALAASLENVAARLRRLQRPGQRLSARRARGAPRPRGG